MRKSSRAAGAAMGLRGLVALLLLVAPASMGEEQAPPENATGQRTAPAAEGSIGGLLTLGPEDAARPTAIGTWGRGLLFAEARYNYEADRTGSIFVGPQFSGGSKLSYWIAPMVGAAVGKAQGIVPALKLELGLGPVTWYAESEWFVDLQGAEGEGDFLYTWSELTVRVRDWFQPGLVTQRTRTVESGLELDRGLMAACEWGRLRIGLYGFNLDRHDRYAIIGFALGFE